VLLRPLTEAHEGPDIHVTACPKESSTAGHPANHTKAFDVMKIAYYKALPSNMHLVLQMKLRDVWKVNLNATFTLHRHQENQS